MAGSKAKRQPEAKAYRAETNAAPALPGKPGLRRQKRGGEGLLPLVLNGESGTKLPFQGAGWLSCYYKWLFVVIFRMA